MFFRLTQLMKFRESYSFRDSILFLYSFFCLFFVHTRQGSGFTPGSGLRGTICGARKESDMASCKASAFPPCYLSSRNPGSLRCLLTIQCSTGTGFHGMLLVWWATQLVLGHLMFHREKSRDLGKEKYLIYAGYQLLLCPTLHFKTILVGYCLEGAILWGVRELSLALFLGYTLRCSGTI